MSNTTLVSGSMVSITGLDENWVWSTELSDFAGLGAIKVKSIAFDPGAANDEMQVRNGGIDGAPLLKVTVAGVNDQRIKYFNPPIWCQPYIDISDCTLGSAATSEVLIELA